jgi:hypothetical protein
MRNINRLPAFVRITGGGRRTGGNSLIELPSIVKTGLGTYFINTLRVKLRRRGNNQNSDAKAYGYRPPFKPHKIPLAAFVRQ